MELDERPWGWGICSVCGEDCEEADYDERARQSICRACHAAMERLCGDDAA